MVLEHIVSYKRMRENPAILLTIAYVFVSFAMVFTALVYPQGGGLFIVALTTMPAIPLFLNSLQNKEKAYENDKKLKKAGLLDRLGAYKGLIRIYGIFFIGITLSVAFWATYLPEDMSKGLFSYQQDELTRISGLAAGSGTRFEVIFNNNFVVMILMFILSILYSMGAVFMLIWNASILGVFLSEFARSALSGLGYMGVFAFPMALFIGIARGLVGIVMHGTFEFLSFFLASISGGILSVAVESKIFKTPRFGTIFKDVLFLFALAVISLAFAAYLEASYLIRI